MLNQIFDSVFLDSKSTINPGMLILSIGVSLLLGILLAAVYKYKTLYTKEFVLYTKEFVITICLLPSLIAIIIFLVNGNVGTSVAVAGTFSLIRFRSAAGGAKEILSIFIATAIGIATGMGLLLLATAFTFLLSAMLIIYENTDFTKASQTRRQVIITVPDSLDYEYLLEGIFSNTCTQVEFSSLKTLSKKKALELIYVVNLKAEISDKNFIDRLLDYKHDIEVSISRAATKKKVL